MMLILSETQIYNRLLNNDVREKNMHCCYCQQAKLMLNHTLT